MDGEKVQDLIYDWLGRVYPEGPPWDDPDSDCFQDAPLEIKMISAFDAIEYNLNNGGWSQLLWNCFSQWRKLIEIGKSGYLLIGASDQAKALDRLRTLCERDAFECERERTQADEDEAFTRFTSRSYGRSDDDTEWEELFYYNSGIYERRLAWLATHEGRIRKLVGALQA